VRTVARVLAVIASGSIAAATFAGSGPAFAGQEIDAASAEKTASVVHSATGDSDSRGGTHVRQ
jgi:hypothetical protein